ncbi:gamma-aminobutyric acid type B receptor subunit 2-like [Asterias rubens]|uniref:gamma-aminobutyric acid type B receptor subunit 2-like n=1 Tax=Asterias rubens TaxID=7604 RepID=UPI0014558EFF|nr:gamma-aminobutyric acid type B receptor subunit 2-like [Asterias rubens]
MISFARGSWLNLEMLVRLLLALVVFQEGVASRKDKEPLYLLGMFPTYLNQSMHVIGKDCLLSARLALKHVNENPDILRDFSLEMVEIDTVNQEGWTVNELLQELFMNYSERKNNVIMMIGPLRNEITQIVARSTKYWNLLQISYGSHSPELADRQTYPLLYRTIMSSTGYNDPRLLMIRQWGWKRVATLGRTDLTMAMEDMQTKLINNSIEIIAKETYDDDLVQPFKFFKEKEVRIIVGNFYENHAKFVFCEAYRAGLYGPKYVWMIFGHYHANWWLSGDLNGCTPEEMSAAVEGAVSVGFQTLSKKNVETVGKITPSDYREIMLNMTGTDYNTEINPAPFSYDAIWAAAIALNSSIARIKPQTLDQFNYNDTNMSIAFKTSLDELQFMGVSGLVSFDAAGDRRGECRIKRIINGTDHDIGYYRGTDSIIWYYTVEEIFASSGGKPPDDHDITVTDYQKDSVSYELLVSMTAFASVGIAMACGFLAFNIFYRNERLIKMSSPNLNDLIIVGCIMIYVTAILLGVDARLLSDSQLKIMCQFRAWLFGVSFTLSFGAMFSKTWRVYSIFTNKKLQKRVIKDYRLFVMVGILLLIDIAILTLWQILDNVTVRIRVLSKKDEIPDRPNTIVVLQQHNCGGELSTYFIWAVYIYKGLLLVFGTFIVWQTRNVNIPALNDSKYIGLSIYNVVIFSALGVPLSYLLADNSGYTYAIVGGLIIFCTTLTLCLLFLPKVLRIIYGYAPEEVGTRVMSNINGRQGTRNGPSEERTRSVMIGGEYSTVVQDERERSSEAKI